MESEQTRKLQDAQAEKLTSLQANKSMMYWQAENLQAIRLTDEKRFDDKMKR